jgi:CBS domain-containing protein
MQGIKEFMSHTLVTASPNATAADVRELMNRYDIGAIPIAETDELQRIIGIVTDSNLRNIEDGQTPVDRIMSRQLYFIDQNASTASAAALMLENGIHHLLVRKCEQWVGMISSFDLIKQIATGKMEHFHNSLMFV